MFIKEVDSPQLMSKMDENDDLVIIDVREMHEIARGTIQSAVAMPMATVPVRLNDIPKDKEVVFICRSGARSGQVCMFLGQHGYENVINLRGGMIGWVRSGYEPVLPGQVSSTY
ncbi:MAG: rhodanese-like domain-containing protein [Pseudomonadota bacterium]|nr:rhodanese-like domain-containing protein [Pseudomonadota bacterium]